MAVIGTEINRNKAITLDATDEFTHWVSVGEPRAGLVVVYLEFDSSWAGTIRFEGAVKLIAVAGTVTYASDPIAATNLVNGTTVASQTTGGVSSTEIWRIDAAGLDGVRAYAASVTGGVCTVTYTWTLG